MTSFSIASGGTTTFTDTTPDGGVVIDFDQLDNGFSVQVNGVDLFVGGPGGAPNELEFQTSGTPGQTVRFADGSLYGTGGIQQIWQQNQSGASTDPILRLVINPDGTIELFGVKAVGAPLEPLELFNGLSVNTAAIDAAWNDTGNNSIVIDQRITGPTNARGEFSDIICFGAGTLIATDDGDRAVEALKVGDQVLTLDHGYQPIRWIGSVRLDSATLKDHPRLRPIRIRASALGAGYPQRDLLVSPQHRILVSSTIAQRMFDEDAVLIPAKKLTCLDGIDVVEETENGVHYVHLLCDTHEIVWSNGTPTETLLIGAEALKSVSAAARQEIQMLFPDCGTAVFKPAAARHVPASGKRMEKLAQRHQRNGKPLFDTGATLGGETPVISRPQ